MVEGQPSPLLRRAPVEPLRRRRAMTNMSPAEAIYFAALDRGTPAERAAYLDEACGADRALRRRVERLLAVQPHVGHFLDRPALLVQQLADAGDDTPHAPGAGATPGPAGPGKGAARELPPRYQLCDEIA